MLRNEKGKVIDKKNVIKEKRGMSKNIKGMLRNKRGMEMVQVAILVAIAVLIGLIFRSEITEFVENTFSNLNGSAFS